MKTRSVKKINYSEMINMGEIPVRQPLPTLETEQIDPFLLLHHHVTRVRENSHPGNVGVGPHPHRGFSPVTFIIEGSVHHRDSRDHSSVVKAGGIQWMNAGRGIMHSERPGAELAEQGGAMEIVQLWINTPKKHKMDEPEYFALQKEEIPTFKTEDGKAQVQVVSGEQKGVKGKINGKSPLLILRVDAQAGAKVSIDIPKSYNASLYLYKGDITLDGYGLAEELNMIEFEQDGDGIAFETKADGIYLVLAGEPIGEPVASYGPFVMNSQTELMEAMRDYQIGKMGMLFE